ncbi:putative amidinotransferase [Pseudogulbenkiania sp. NH8B]|uniref:citrulline utilization hydrolase CtlX n=1 Tax=Pseudogulbenkiania sp. (strain NH8B) TaxID=748280 RepID=UPI0002279EAC|nr:arginine deiminase-related protein [Pseudogulbenkiania sp. NH8B]BAK77790.1 putative amidinotransferase [Pseudogulbenkiania sp. NH8B]
MQTTSTILMIRPARFLSNPQTSPSNTFQKSDIDHQEAQQNALAEFDAYAGELRRCGVDVLVIDDTVEPHTPDSIFPNNWISLHADGKVLLYPMEAPNRRLERNNKVLEKITEAFAVEEVIDLSGFERVGQYHEGTGTMIFDHNQKMAYVCFSSRSSEAVMKAVSETIGYQALWFHSVDRHGKPIYHTNVMMCVGKTLAVVCLESIRDRNERTALVQALTASGKEIIDISYDQLEHFAGNMLELSSRDGEAVFALSRQAWSSLTPEQQTAISSYARVAQAPIDTIERLGGGGARCMIAEIFLPRRAC